MIIISKEGTKNLNLENNPILILIAHLSLISFDTPNPSQKIRTK
jgi:hypothetical protein